MGPQVKGIAYRSVLRALEQLRGPEVVETALVRMPAALCDAIRFGTIVSASWYPIEWYRALLRAIADTTDNPSALLRDIARESARMDMVGIYRTAFKLLSPQALFNVSARLFSNYYDTGQLLIIEARSGYVHARWTNCVGFDERLWLEVFAASSMYLELAGAVDVETELIAGGGATDETAEVQARWS